MIKLRALMFVVLSIGLSTVVLSETKQSTIHLGALLPVTGDYSQYGTELWRGIELAAIEANTNEDTIKVTLENSATMSAKTSVSGAHKLINIDKVDVLAVLGSDDVQPLIGLARNSDLAILSLWDNSKALEDLGEFVFSNGFSLEATASMYVEYALTELKADRVAIISSETTWSTAITELFRSSSVKHGGQIVFSETVEDSWTDFRSLIPRLIKSKPNVIFIPLALPSTVNACIRQFREHKLDLPIFTGEAFVGSAMKQLGAYADNVYVGWLPQPEAGLVKKYMEKYGTKAWDPGIVQVGYNGAKSVIDSFKSSAGGTIRSALIQHFGIHRRADNRYNLYKAMNGSLHLVGSNLNGNK